MRIGIDFDGVIVDHREHTRLLAAERGFSLERWQTNSNLLGRFVPPHVHEEVRRLAYGRLTPDAPPVPGALEVLKELRGELYIVSARTAESVRFAQEWMLTHHVYDVVPAERIFFCGSTSEKRGYCERLGIDVFIDDKLDVLDSLPYATTKALLDTDGIAHELEIDPKLHVVPGWEEFRALAATKAAKAKH